MFTTLVGLIVLAHAPAEPPKTFEEVEKLKWEAYQGERPYKTNWEWKREHRSGKVVVVRLSTYLDKGRTRVWFWTGSDLSMQASSSADSIWMIAYQSKTFWLTSAPPDQAKELAYTPLKCEADSFRLELANSGFPQLVCDPPIVLDSITDVKLKGKDVRLVTATSTSRKHVGTKLTVKQWFDKDKWLLVRAEWSVTGEPALEETNTLELQKSVYRTNFLDSDFAFPKEEVKGFTRVTPPTGSA